MTSLVVNHHVGCVGLVDYQFYGVEEFAGVATAYAHYSLGFFQFYFAALLCVVFDGFLHQLHHFWLAKLFEYKHLATREQCRDDLERWIFGSGTYESQYASLYGTEQ